MSETPKLCLITPPVAEPAAFSALLEAALSAAEIASVHLRLATSDEKDVKRFLQALAPIVQDKGAALIVDPPSDLRNVARWGADGVHVMAGDAVKDALSALKPDRIVGVGGLRSKDSAMTAGENGVDYVLFGEPRADGTVPPPEQVIERCQWWAEVFNTPCIGYAADAAMVGPVAKTGAEFVALGPWAISGSAAEVRGIVTAAAKALKG
jgi:thiamine-phosphate pyrophosphorylase